MSKLDLKKEYKPLYTASAKEAVLVLAPPIKFLMLNGSGDPNLNPEFQAGIEALYTASYTLKFMLKQAQGLDYMVPPLEGLWWMLLADFDPDRRDDWRWTLMIPQPEPVSRKVLDLAVTAAQKKKPLPALERLRLEIYDEGQAAQILHVGPYGEEAASIERLHAFIKEKGYHFCGKHHEIYLSDPRRTAPEKLKTILRQPISLEAMK
ncbi:MAG: GyrI-like domain-containing protein [Deltaproteobacteria bacterium]|nr:GyrI-like domain-containing protein [Deltaproteobacteria bacterium]